MNQSDHDAPLPPDLAAIITEAARDTPPVESVELVESTSTDFNEFNKFNATPRPERVHPIPEDSTLAIVRDISRDFSEAPDCFAIAPFLALVGGVLTPRCYWDFGGKKFPNVFQFVVGPPGIRKSTSFKIAELVGKASLSPDAFHGGNASDSAAFAKWQKQPHRIQIESEGNTVVTSWRGSYAGREIAARMLKLHDGDSWSQTFRHQEDKDGDGAEQTIECATLSIAIGATPSVCRFDGVDAKNGLRRRFGYYAADGAAREIEWPRSLATADLEDVVKQVRAIADLEGQFTLDDAARKLWTHIQRRNRADGEDIFDDASEEAEIRKAELAEAPSRALKLAAQFSVCRFASGSLASPFLVGEETLELAYLHQAACLEASRSVDAIAHRSAVAEEAERILATIRAEAASNRDFDRWTIKGEAVRATRSEITRRFAPNGSRSTLTTQRLHTLVMPLVIQQAKGDTQRTEGGGTVYIIPMEAQP